MQVTPKEFRSARIALGWSHAELAQRLGVSATLIGKWEHGDATIDDASAVALAHALLPVRRKGARRAARAAGVR